MVSVRLRIACLAFALLWAQWLGLSHAIWHSPLLRGAETRQKADAKPAHESQAQASPSGAGLFAHDSDAQCCLFDQLAHSDALNPTALNWVGPTPVSACAALAPALVPVRFALAYSARAPPPFLS
jgi:hypothetical protein